MYLYYGGECYRTLLETEDGNYVISVSGLTEPRFFSPSALQACERIDLPESISIHPTTERQKERLQIVQAIAEDDTCIYDRQKRREKIYALAKAQKVQPRTIQRILYQYWAVGSADYCFVSKNETIRKTITPFSEYFKYAIQNYYFSAAKMSLKDAYDKMLLASFTSPFGKILENAPTYYQFKNYYYRNSYHLSPRKQIARNGLTAYQRNSRQLYDTSAHWRNQIGSFQMDATVADIYLVSRYDRTVVGRPYIFLAVDVFSQMIAGIYIGYENNEEAVLACLNNCVEDKVAFCREYGIEITQEDWPVQGLPREVIFDKGREFSGSRMKEIVLTYGTEMHALPSFRPDEKGLVEKTFDILQNKYKHLLRGKGVIEEDSQERWATDYRKQAVLDIDEFTKIILRIVVFLNRRTLKHYQQTREMVTSLPTVTPASIWSWCEHNQQSNMLEVDPEEFYRFSLTRIKTKVSQRGIVVNRLTYNTRDVKLRRGEKVEIAYNKNDASCVYLVEKSNMAVGFQPIPLASAMEQYAGLSFAEYAALKNRLSAQSRQCEAEETQARVALLSDIAGMLQKEDET